MLILKKKFGFSSFENLATSQTKKPKISSVLFTKLVTNCLGRNAGIVQYN